MAAISRASLSKGTRYRRCLGYSRFRLKVSIRCFDKDFSEAISGIGGEIHVDGFESTFERKMHFNAFDTVHVFAVGLVIGFVTFDLKSQVRDLEREFATNVDIYHG
jgi:hypothetical protein